MIRALTIIALAQLVAVAAPVAALAQTATPTAPSSECYARQELAARSPGFLERVLVAEGQEVKKGDVILELDARLLKTAVREAKAGVSAAKANLDLALDGLSRLKQLAAKDTVAPQELFQAEIRVDQAKAGHDQARAVYDRTAIQLDDTVLRAAFDGRVQGLPQVKGLYVQAGQTLGRVEAGKSACQAGVKP